MSIRPMPPEDKDGRMRFHFSYISMPSYSSRSQLQLLNTKYQPITQAIYYFT